MDEEMDSRKMDNGPTDIWTDSKSDGWIEIWLDRQMDRPMYEWMAAAHFSGPFL